MPQRHRLRVTLEPGLIRAAHKGAARWGYVDLHEWITRLCEHILRSDSASLLDVIQVKEQARRARERYQDQGTVQIPIRLTADTLAALAADATFCDVTHSDYLRALLLMADEQGDPARSPGD